MSTHGMRHDCSVPGCKRSAYGQREGKWICTIHAKKTVQQMMRERQEDLAKMLVLIEQWEQCARLNRQRAPEAAQSAEIGAKVGQAEALEACARELREALGLKLPGR